MNQSPPTCVRRLWSNRYWISIITVLCVLSSAQLRAVMTSSGYTAMVKSDGTVWAWGDNTYGQLGDGTTTTRTVPTQVSGLTGAVAVAVGENHTLAVKNDGTVWAWGNNWYGQLGDGTSTDRLTPVQVGGLSNVVAVAAGDSFSLALKSDGTLWGWGGNSVGQLGDGTTTDQMTPVQVGGLSGVIRIASGTGHALAIKSNGTVWAWGGNWLGQLGDGTTTDRLAPVQISGLSGVTSVAASANHSMALRNDGTVWTWGLNYFGQLGDGSNDQRLAPVQVTGLTGVTGIAAGDSFSMAVKSNGTVWGWGVNNEDQLADGTFTDQLTPVQISGLASIVSLFARFSHTIAVKADGTVVAWGFNAIGQLGDGSIYVRPAPVQVSKQLGVVKIVSGGYGTMALKPDGTVWAWGGNWYGQLGDGTTDSRSAPTQVTGVTSATAIAMAVDHSLAVKTDGTVRSWGVNINGQLGDGTTTDRTSPVQVNVLTSVAGVAAGLSHSVAFKTDGTVWAWGKNSNGQLGDNTTTQRTSPVSVSTLSGITAIAAGSAHTVALKNNGTVWTWGKNSNGQLGDNSTTQRKVPVQVNGLSNVTAVVAGVSHTVALKADGTVWAWGYNGSGQLGDNTTTQRKVPVQVNGLSNVIAIAAGDSHTVAVKNDGTVWAWGSNWSGELGDTTTTSRMVPVQVSGLSGSVVVMAASQHTIALLGNGTLRGWGDNTVGQLAFERNKIVPVPIRVSASTLDLDQDAMLDSWEQLYFGSLSHSGGTDSDGDGLSDLHEHNKGSHPGLQDVDTDLLTDFVDLVPNDFYNGEAPTLTILSGDNQTGTPGEFNTAPFDVGVWNAKASAPWINAPLSFTVTLGGGGLANVATDTPVSSLPLLTDQDGTAQAFYKHVTTPGVASVVTVSAGSAQVILYTATESNNPDSDGDELPDAWETQYFGNLNLTAAGDSDQDGLSNLQEYQMGANPANNDTDNDGMPDGWEAQHGLNLVINDATGDLDGDGHNNLQEFQAGTDPDDPNSPVHIPLNVQISTPNAGDILPAGVDALLVAVPNGGDNGIVKVEFFVGADKLGELAAAPFQHTWTSPVEGSHDITARVTDGVGHTFTSSALNVRVGAQVPFVSEFEAVEGYVLGELNTQKGWSASSGIVISGEGAEYGAQGIFLPPNSTPTQATKYFARPTNQPIVFASFYANGKAAATAAEGLLFDMAGALVSMVKKGTSAEFYAYDGNGTGGGIWRRVEYNYQIDLGSDGLPEWALEFVLRFDFVRKHWDLTVDGLVVAADLGLIQDNVGYLDHLTLHGNATHRAVFDRLRIDFQNPGFTDADRDNMDDAWETSRGLNAALDDRDGDGDHDELTNIHEYISNTELDNADSDDDGLTDGFEVRNRFDPWEPTYPTDEDEDGFSQIQEAVNGTDPADYFNGATPEITILSGEGSPTGEFVVKVHKPDGTPYANAPVNFSVPATAASLAGNPDSTNLFQAITRRTGSDGVVRVFIRPSDSTE